MQGKKLIVPSFETEAREAAWWEKNRSVVEADLRAAMREGRTTSLQDIIAKPGQKPVVRASEVHLWQIALDRPPTEQEQLLHLLSAEERDRMSRFRFPDDRRRYLESHAILRQILSRYLDTDPVSLRFITEPNGKPHLDPDRLTFNLSHSGEMALVAVGATRQVGVDIERIRDDVAALDIARQFFTDEEAERLAALPAAEQRAAFFTMWTRKEALGKARGLVLGQALRDMADSGGGWRVETVEAPPGYAAAAAGEGHDWAVRWVPS